MLRKSYEKGVRAALEKTGSFPEFLDVPFSFNYDSATDEKGSPVDVRVDGTYNLLGPIVGAGLGAAAGHFGMKHLKGRLPPKLQEVSPLLATIGAGFAGSRAGAKLEGLRTALSTHATVSPRDQAPAQEKTGGLLKEAVSSAWISQRLKGGFSSRLKNLQDKGASPQELGSHYIRSGDANRGVFEAAPPETRMVLNGFVRQPDARFISMPPDARQTLRDMVAASRKAIPEGPIGEKPLTLAERLRKLVL